MIYSTHRTLYSINSIFRRNIVKLKKKTAEKRLSYFFKKKKISLIKNPDYQEKFYQFSVKINQCYIEIDLFQFSSLF